MYSLWFLINYLIHLMSPKTNLAWKYTLLWCFTCKKDRKVLYACFSPLFYCLSLRPPSQSISLSHFKLSSLSPSLLLLPILPHYFLLTTFNLFSLLSLLHLLITTLSKSCTTSRLHKCLSLELWPLLENVSYVDIMINQSSN